MGADPECIFCRIIAREIPSFTLYEDEASVSFMDINPASEGHALVVPKEHAEDIHAVSREALAAAAVTAQRVAGAVVRTLNPDGLNLVQCNGRAAAQSIWHFHIHVLPRSEGDDLKLNWGLRPGDKDAIGVLAERIRANL